MRLPPKSLEPSRQRRRLLLHKHPHQPQGNLIAAQMSYLIRESLKAAIHSLLEQKVEGIAIMTSEITAPLIQIIAARGIPLVLAVPPAAFHETLSQKNVSNILIDYYSGMQQAVDHIFALGHKHLAFIGGPQTMRSAAWRQNVFFRILQEKGIALDADYLAVGNYRVDGGNTAMRKLLQCRHRPTAVLASNDLMAIGAISAIYEAGLQVPRDISHRL